MKTSRAVLVMLFFCFVSFPGYGQITFPIDVHDGQVVETCTGFFADSGEDTLSFYGPNENYSMAFCSADPQNQELISLAFSFFELGAGDVMLIYDGDSDQAPLLASADNNDLQDSTVYGSGQCLYVEFVSSASDQGRGWLAEINCLSLCDAFAAAITSSEEDFDFCPDAGSIAFEGRAGYLPDNIDDNPASYNYLWLVDGTTYTTRQISHDFPAPGAYTMNLTVEDPLTGCLAEVSQVVRVGTVPSFAGTMATVEQACAATPFSLVGEATPSIWSGFPTSVTQTAPVPDATGDAWESSLTFEIFDAGDQVVSALDIDRICINMEHVSFGQLQLELECPNGGRVMLKDFGAGTANLGEPVVWDNVTPGIGYDYCFTPEPQLGTMPQTTPLYHEYTDQAGNYYFNAAYLPSGNYTPEQTLNALAGCPLDGEWTLRVRDNVPGDNGHVFSWTLLFDEELYPDSLIFSPQIVAQQWSRQGQPLEGNPAVVSETEPGEYEYTYSVTDNFGCSFDTSLVVTILPLPQAQVISDPEIPICEGDSTLLTVIPFEDDPQHWVYQWMIQGENIPEATYDTLLARQPVAYTVMVQDTLSGCADFVDITVSTQNCDLTIPNVFTPNGDGINDVFEVLNLEHYPMAQIAIFNRWGKRVFEHSDYFGNWWDGDEHPAGVYYYVLTYMKNQEVMEAHGAVTILR
ncbi:MAG: gliding motility-associated C-terminal domain-containing protein [Bacteroidales bacterium]